MLADLVHAYAGRPYHNLDHLRFMLDFFQRHQADLANADAVLLALLYHDVIYDTRAAAGDSERASARFLDGLIPDLRHVGGVVPAQSMILCTINHRPDSADAAHLLDWDLAILSEDPAVVDAYDLAIRQEYDWVPVDQFAQGRAKVLRRFLDQDRLYYTPAFAPREPVARTNLARLIRRWDGG